MQTMTAEHSEKPYFATSWQKLSMWLFIITDALLFAGFLASYGVSRLSADTPWPDQSKVFDLNFVTAMTFVLITSSATMATAVAAAKFKDMQKTVNFLFLTVLIGAGFLGMQVYEWSHFIQDGARLDGNPWGPVAFSSYFFVMTGFHGTHVLLGAVILLLTALKIKKRGTIDENIVEVAGLYWHFVDLVWVFIFGLFYLI